MSSYYPRNSIRKLFRQYRQYGYWKVRVIQKHKLPASVRHVIPGLFVFLLIFGFLLTGTSFITYSLTQSLPAKMLLYISSTALLGISGFYLLSTIVAAIITGLKSNLKYTFILPFIFGAFHIGYGLGFIEGILDFVIIKRAPSTKKTKLTR